MFDKIYKNAPCKKKHLTAPLLEERVTYLKYLDNRGRSVKTIKETANCLLKIIKLLRLKTKRTITRKEIKKAANVCAKSQCNYQRKQQSFSIYSENYFICHAINWLKMIGYLKAPPENVALFYKIFEREDAINRHLNAPLLHERVKYLQYWANNGAALRTLEQIAPYLLLIIDYLDLKNKKLVTVAEIEKAGLLWVTTKNKPRKIQADYSKIAKNRFIYYAVRWLKMINRLSIV
jgi:hypothetical protein